MASMASLGLGGREDFSGAGLGGGGYDTGGGLGASLPRLVQETELQKMLADEKMRSEQHKTNYITLKAEHNKLQDDYRGIQDDLRTTIEECRLIREKYERLLAQSRGSLAEKLVENETLRGQVLDPRKLEKVKLELEGEISRPMRDKFERLEAELDKTRAELNKIKYEYTFVKSEYDHLRSINQSTVEEMKLRHEAEVTNLRKEREAMIARHDADGATDSQRLRLVQKENVALGQKVKGLLSELEELRARREHAGLQADSVARIQVKQITESQAAVKALEAERLSLRQQVDDLQREITLANDSQSHQSSRVHALERDNQSLRSRAEEAEHKAKLDLSNLRVELLRERGDLERERDKLRNQLAEFQTELESAQHTIAELERSLVDKEREGVAKVLAASEEAWQKLHHVEADKLALEARVAELEKQRIDSEEDLRKRMDETEQERRRAHETTVAAERDVTNMRSKLENQQLLLDKLDSTQAENSELRVRLQKLQAQYEEFVDGERDVVGENERLEREIEVARGEARTAREQALRAKDETEGIIARERSGWMEEKLSLQSRIESLDSQLSTVARKLSTSSNLYKQKKGKLKSLILKLRDRVNLLQAKCDQLQIEKEAVRRAHAGSSTLNGGGSVDDQVRRRLKDLLQRNREFRAVLQATQIKQVDIGGLQFGCLVTPNHSPAGATYNDLLPAFNAFFDMNQKELSILKDRVDHLDLAQRQQMDELKPNSALFTGPAPSTLRLLEGGENEGGKTEGGRRHHSSLDSREAYQEGSGSRRSPSLSPGLRDCSYGSDEENQSPVDKGKSSVLFA